MPLGFTLPDDITQRDADVAATVIQWLGSNIGQSFLYEVEKKILEERPEAEVKIAERRKIERKAAEVARLVREKIYKEEQKEVELERLAREKIRKKVRLAKEKEKKIQLLKEEEKRNNPFYNIVIK